MVEARKGIMKDVRGRGGVRFRGMEGGGRVGGWMDGWMSGLEGRREDRGEEGERLTEAVGGGKEGSEDGD